MRLQTIGAEAGFLDQETFDQLARAVAPGIEASALGWVGLNGSMQHELPGQPDAVRVDPAEPELPEEVSYKSVDDSPALRLLRMQHAREANGLPPLPIARYIVNKKLQGYGHDPKSTWKGVRS